jgi:hypothetical protein
VLRPIGSFHTARLVVRASHVEQWLNGVLVVAYTLEVITIYGILRLP